MEVRLGLVRSKDAFCLMDASAVNYSVHITEATLLVCRVNVNHTVLVAHSKTLASTTAKYPITRVEVKSFTIRSGVNGQCLENVILRQLPKRVVLGFVDNKAFNGDRKLNPFNFLKLFN